MRTITILWIIAAIFLVIGVVGKLIKKEDFKITEKGIFHRFYGFGILTIWFLFISNGIQYSYYMDFAEEDRVEFHIPCIDSTMVLYSRENYKETWRSYSDYNRNGIKHTKKIIIINRGGILRETDYFLNIKESKELVLETTIPNFLIKKKTNHKLKEYVKGFEFFKVKRELELSDKQADSVVKSWDLGVYYDCNLDRHYTKKKDN